MSHVLASSQGDVLAQKKPPKKPVESAVGKKKKNKKKKGNKMRTETSDPFPGPVPVSKEKMKKYQRAPEVDVVSTFRMCI